MKNNIKYIFILPILLFFACKNPKEKDLQTKTILMNIDQLEQAKILFKQGDSNLKYAFDTLIKTAEIALNQGPFSVTNKEIPAPSKNINDYASYSRYWWPDPNKTDGLPYIRKDGETNPDSQSLKYSDRQRIGAFSHNTETLGLAYYLTGDEKYAKKAAELIKVWFLKEETKMNPNVNHAQIRPGHNQGSKSGVLDGRTLIHALEGSLLIANSPSLSKKEHQQIKRWAKEYLTWLTTNKLALEEANSKNNHGSFYDTQVMYFSLFTDQKEIAKKNAQNFIKNRLYAQIMPDGSMPEEMARTRPLFYSIYNLHAMFVIAHLAKKVKVDIWQANQKDSRLRKALDYLVPYTDSNKAWPHKTLKETDRMKLFMILQMADIAYPNQNYLKEAEVLPFDKLKIQRSNIAFPLIR